MRVAMLVVRTRGEQPPGFAQVRADRPVGGVELGVDDAALPAEPGPVLAVLAIAFNRELGAEPMRLAQLEIVLAVIGRHVDQARAAVGGDKVARQQRPRLGKEPAEVVHRVAQLQTDQMLGLQSPTGLTSRVFVSPARAAFKLFEQSFGYDH